MTDTLKKVRSTVERHKAMGAKHTPDDLRWHTHHLDGRFLPDCPRCVLDAAAPDLLEALNNLLHAFPGEYTEPPKHITDARAALAKARGES